MTVLNRPYLEQAIAHRDEGSRFDHLNAVSFLKAAEALMERCDRLEDACRDALEFGAQCPDDATNPWPTVERKLKAALADGEGE